MQQIWINSIFYVLKKLNSANAQVSYKSYLFGDVAILELLMALRCNNRID